MPSIEFAQAFASARDRSARNAPWIHQVGLVEHHQNGHWVLRGTFAGHYLDVDDALHVSERGGAEGFAAGAVLGSLMGPPGFAAGMVLGAIIGSQTAQPNEHDPEPRLLSEQLRDRLHDSGSAIALIAETADVNDNTDCDRRDARERHAAIAQPKRFRFASGLPTLNAGRFAGAHG